MEEYSEGRPRFWSVQNFANLATLAAFVGFSGISHSQPPAQIVYVETPACSAPVYTPDCATELPENKPWGDECSDDEFQPTPAEPPVDAETSAE